MSHLAPDFDKLTIEMNAECWGFLLLLGFCVCVISIIRDSIPEYKTKRGLLSPLTRNHADPCAIFHSSTLIIRKAKPCKHTGNTSSRHKEQQKEPEGFTD